MSASNQYSRTRGQTVRFIRSTYAWRVDFASAAKTISASSLRRTTATASTLFREGALAQLGERRLCKPEVAGSIPARSISVQAKTTPPSKLRGGLSQHRRSDFAAAQESLKLRRLVACVGSAFPFSDHSTFQPTRQPIHTAAAIHGRAKHTPSTKPRRSERIATKVSVV
jgi:hypothetical protein